MKKEAIAPLTEKNLVTSPRIHPWGQSKIVRLSVSALSLSKGHAEVQNPKSKIEWPLIGWHGNTEADTEMSLPKAATDNWPTARRFLLRSKNTGFAFRPYVRHITEEVHSYHESLKNALLLGKYSITYRHNNYHFFDVFKLLGFFVKYINIKMWFAAVTVINR